MGLGARIKDLLYEKGLTIKDLSEITGIPVNTLYSITGRDDVNIRADNLEKIAKALDLSIDQLLTGKVVQNELMDALFGSYINTKDNVADIHFSTDDYTMEEIEEIIKFAEFIKSKRNK